MVFQPDQFWGSKLVRIRMTPKGKFFCLETVKNFHVNHILIRVDPEDHLIKFLQCLLSPSSRATPWSSSPINFWDSKLVWIRMNPKEKLFISKLQITFMLNIFSLKLILKTIRSIIYNIF